MSRALLGEEFEAGISCADCQALQHPAVIASDWFGFLCLSLSALALMYKYSTFKGPNQDDAYYFGYRERAMMSMFVNLFAALAYWAKLASHANGDVGPAASVVHYKYLDYLLTCPLLTVDLLWMLNLPYKFTAGGMVAACIVCAYMATALPAPAKFMWFGMGIFLFAATWSNILLLVKARLEQMVSKQVKQVRLYLKTACITYFAIWLGYPTLWLAYELGGLSAVASHLCHVLFDVLAKCVYGFAMLYVQMRSEKNDFIFLQLRPTVEKDDEEPDDEGGQIIIGSKQAKKNALSTSRETSFSFPTRQTTQPWEMTNVSSDVEEGKNEADSMTKEELNRINRQIETLMARGAV